MMKFIKNSNGSSIVQGLIMAGFLAGTALVTTRLLSDQKQVSKTSETRDDIEQLHSLIYAILQNQDYCKSTMISNGAHFTLISGSNPSLANINMGGSPSLEIHPTTGLDPSKIYMNGNVIIKSMAITYPVSAPPKPGHAHLKVSYQRIKKGVGTKDISKQILLKIQRDPNTGGNPFETCYAVKENDATLEAGNSDLHKTVCEGMNSTGTNTGQSLFVWNESLSSCQLKENICSSPGQIFIGINANGTAECRSLISWFDFSRVVDPSPTSCSKNDAAFLSVTGNKIKVVCSP